jgi:alpha-amylase/alpha-mannosidase (GH57 family)
MLWLNFLHFYQPANIEDYKIKEALDKSYWRLVRLMEEHPNLKMTWNISGCLLERLADNNETSFLERLKSLVKKGQVELTGSAAYHGFLPLLPETEVISQIKTNEKILIKYFGASFKKAGFFLPEMAYSPQVARIIKKLGYQWLVLDEASRGQGFENNFDFNHVYLDEASKLKLVFRSRKFSGAYPPDKLLDILNSLKDNSLAEDKFFITATDAELYGLRHEDPTGEMERIAKNKKLKTETISEFIKKTYSKKEKTIKIYNSSWEATPAEIKKNEAYNLWFDKKNKIQTYLWKLAYLCLDLDKQYKKDKNYYWYRWHLVRGLASCTFWWASGRDFSKIYGPYTWSPDDIERGLEDLVRSVRSLSDLKTKKKKLEAEKYYLRIKELIWSDHWNKHWQKIV